MPRIEVEYRLTIYPTGKAEGEMYLVRNLRTTTIQGIGVAVEFATRHLASRAPQGTISRAKLTKVYPDEADHPNWIEHPVADWFGASDGKSWFLNAGSLDWAHSIEVSV